MTEHLSAANQPCQDGQSSGAQCNQGRAATMAEVQGSEEAANRWEPMVHGRISLRWIVAAA
jgi:hypothetical protein